ncbi:VanZ family protein [Methylomonas albis]|uniref:VanZ family protein n=1 Tax=Methylomonas albis TaxID=1854563 RepID=A0ABR9D831_9GAMM|nr:VanZ family protein [Methylomonas albis]MBD9358419.1 VanZ family protein [Methylomonas albis]
MANLKGNRKLAILFVLLSIAWILFLFAESSQPPAKIMSSGYGVDKLAHFVAFGILALLVCSASLCLRGKNKNSTFFFVLVLVTIVGVADECYQLLNPSRAFEFLDLMADIFGAIVFLYVFNIVLKSSLSRWFVIFK